MTVDSSEISLQLESWYRREGGLRLLAELDAAIAPLLDRSFGYHSLQLGPLSGVNLLRGSAINHRILSSESSERAVEGVGLVCECEQLPLESDSIDLLVAFHALEFNGHPHQCLREMHRVLAPHGHLLVVGFNPLSALGLSQWLRGLAGQALWRWHNAVSQHRLSDWLNLVGCQVEEVRHVCPLPVPGRRRPGGLRSRLDHWAREGSLPLGSLYIAHAIKQVPNLRMRPAELTPVRSLIGLGAAKPAPTTAVLPPRSRDLAA